MSEPDRIRRLSLVGRVLLVLTGVLLSLALAELAVRAQVGSRPASFHIVNAVFGQYDAQFGQRFRPNSKKILSVDRENFLRVWPKSLAELRVVLSEHGVYDVERGWATSDLGANRELRKRQAQQYAGKDQQHTPNQRQSTYPVRLTHDDPSSA